MKPGDLFELTSNYNTWWSGAEISLMTGDVLLCIAMIYNVATFLAPRTNQVFDYSIAGRIGLHTKLRHVA